MDQVYVVRHKVLVEGLSERRVARELGISRATVKRYASGAPPGERRVVARASPVSDEIVARVESILQDAPQWTGGKQRLTAARVHDLLASVHAPKSVRPERSAAKSKGETIEGSFPSPANFAETPDFTSIYKAWFHPVTRWVRAFGGAGSEIEDLAQEVQLFTRWSPPSTGSSATSWRTGIMSCLFARST